MVIMQLAPIEPKLPDLVKDIFDLSVLEAQTNFRNYNLTLTITMTIIMTMTTTMTIIMTVTIMFNRYLDCQCFWWLRSVN